MGVKNLESRNLYIADLHLFHKNVTDKGTNFDNRPFSTIEEMNLEIVKRWNHAVSEQDHVYILGDFIWNFKKNKEAALDVLHALNGKMHLIQGNHDYGIHMPEYRACFQEITSYKKIHDSLQEKPQLVILSHYYMPFYENHYYGSVLLHGHSHMSPESDLERQITANLISRGITERIYNIGCMYPYMDYTPRTLEEIIRSVHKNWWKTT